MLCSLGREYQGEKEEEGKRIEGTGEEEKREEKRRE